MKEATVTVQTEIPIALLNQAQSMIDQGWFRSLDEILLTALRHYLESHRADLMETFMRQDVDWGLNADE